MDLCKDEPQVAAAQQKPILTEEKPRSVLVTSEKNNAVPANGKPWPREIISRPKSGITSGPRSPMATSPTSRTPVPQRAQSAERRRPATPSSPSSRRSAPSSPSSHSSPLSTTFSKSSRPSSPTPRLSSPTPRPSSTPSSTPSSRSTTPVRDSIITEKLNSSRRSLIGRAPDGLWPSMRNLSASFQSDSSSVPGSKNDRQVRNPSPDRTLKSSANAPTERKRTPLRGRNVLDQSENSRPVENSHMRAIDQLRWPGMIGGKVSSHALTTKSMDLADKVSRSASLSTPVRGASPTRRMSSTDAVSRGLKNSTNEIARPVSSHGIEKDSRLGSVARRLNSVSLERLPTNVRPSRSPSPVPRLVHPSSPNKASVTSSSISRGMLSPIRTRPSTPSSPSSVASTPSSSSVFNYITDLRKAKRSPNLTDDSHQLRLLYNRHLQWRFVNARVEAASATQKLIAEDMLYTVWYITSELHESVIVKRNDMENLKQEMKLGLILDEQIAYLEDWSALEAEHANSVSGIADALKASTLRLPVTRGAKADIRAVKNAVSSAVDVMQAMGSSICSLLSRVESTNCLVSELADVAAMENIMLDEYRELLASTAAMQVQECSLRTHLIQLGENAPVD